MEINLTDDEAKTLRIALQSIAIRTRTGELGILHGMDRFISTNRCLKKRERETLDAAAKKLGLDAIRRISD